MFSVVRASCQEIRSSVDLCFMLVASLFVISARDYGLAAALQNVAGASSLALWPDNNVHVARAEKERLCCPR